MIFKIFALQKFFIKINYISNENLYFISNLNELTDLNRNIFINQTLKLISKLNYSYNHNTRLIYTLIRIQSLLIHHFINT